MFARVVIPLLFILLLVSPVVDGFAMALALAQQLRLVLLRLLKVVTQKFLPVGRVVGVQFLFDHLQRREEST